MSTRPALTWLCPRVAPDVFSLWRDLLRSQCKRVPRKTTCHLGLDPATHEPYGADKPREDPNRNYSTFFGWRETATA